MGQFIVLQPLRFEVCKYSPRCVSEFLVFGGSRLYFAQP